MADSKKKYTVMHPVRHDGKLFPRGEGLSLADDDAERLMARGVIQAGAPTVVDVSGPVLTTAETLASLKKLQAMTVPQLVDYGQTTYGLALSGDDRKEALIEQLHERYVLSLAPATGEVL